MIVTEIDVVEPATGVNVTVGVPRDALPTTTETAVLVADA